MKIADLHLHTHYSDGVHSIEDVVAEAKKVGVKVISITDHNWPNNMAEKNSLAIKAGLTYIQGVEIGARDNNTNAHILGYSKNFDFEILVGGLKEQMEQLFERSKKIIENINASGEAKLSAKQIQHRFKGTIGNFPILIELAEFFETSVHDEKVKNFYKKFSLPYGKWHLNPEQAIDLIHLAGGVAVWAHPALYKQKYGEKKFKSIFKKMLNSKIDGLEASHSGQDEFDEAFIRDLAKRNNLFITGGSDFHGLSIHPSRVIGKKGLDEKELELFLKKLD